jgi:hypothetical protein
VVDAVNEHRRVILGRRRQDDFLRAGIDVLLGALLGQEDAGRFDNHFGAHLSPLQIGGVALGGQADLSAVDQQRASLHRDFALETAVDRVIRQQVGEVLGLEQVVDRYHLDVAAEILHRRTQHVATDAAEAIDANLHCHDVVLFDNCRASRGMTRGG